MTPLEISIALHYHVSPGDYGRGTGDNNFGAPAVQSALRRFVDAGLLRKTEAGQAEFRATEGLSVYVDALCSVQFPVQKWVMTP